MASECVMYISVISIGVLLIAGVSLTFNAITNNTLENTVEAGLDEIVNIIYMELKNVLELGMQMDPLTRVVLNRSLDLPRDIAGHFYTINFKVLPGAKHWFIEAVDLNDRTINPIIYESTIPWRNVTLVSGTGTGLPTINSNEAQHYLCFQRSEGTETFRIRIR